MSTDPDPSKRSSGPARSRLGSTYASVMATVAVFLALGGGAYAISQLPDHSVGTEQLRNGSVTDSKLAKAVQQGDGQTFTRSGVIAVSVNGSSSGAEVFQVSGRGKVDVVCGYNHPIVGSRADIVITNIASSPIRAWVNAKTTNPTYNGLHTYVIPPDPPSESFQEATVSADPQQAVIQVQAATVSYTSIVSTRYLPPRGPSGVAHCQWSATTSVKPANT